MGREDDKIPGMFANNNTGWVISIVIFAGFSVLFIAILEDFIGLIIGLIIAGIVLYSINRKAEHYAKQKNDYKAGLDWQYNNQKKELEARYNNRRKEFEEREKVLLKLLKDKTPYNTAASMYADMETYVFEKTQRYLETKPRPAHSSALVVKEMRTKARKYVSLHREIEYKLEVLLKNFPYLKPYIEDESGEALASLGGADLEDVEENYDRARDYLTQEEYSKLGVVDRNQLALDRYNSKGYPKSNWVIGVEYEMYIEYLYREKYGCYTVPHGSLNKLEDLGRDVIAEQYKEGKCITYIIQCKRYSSNIEIHENTICQLYGTTIAYQLDRNQSLFEEDIRPVLYTTTNLSPTAERFAEILEVKVYKTPMGKYPQIKCNVNKKGEKIYHLPFDQKYYNAKIDKEGEFYAWTVKEAEEAGFRRAKKYLFNKD